MTAVQFDTTPEEDEKIEKIKKFFNEKTTSKAIRRLIKNFDLIIKNDEN